MTVSVLSSALLQQSDPTAFTQRIFQRDDIDPASASATELSNPLADAARAPEATRQERLLTDLNTTRSLQYGLTYGASGTASRSTPNTILLGYA